MAFIEKSLTFMTHEGGTKFYEIAAFACDATHRFVMVRRWGKMSAKNGAGQTKLETLASASALQANVASALRDLTGTKRGYNIDGLSTGIKSGTDTFADDMMEEALISHYQDNDTVKGVMSRLDLMSRVDRPVAEIKKTPPSPPKPEPVRSVDWASW